MTEELQQQNTKTFCGCGCGQEVFRDVWKRMPKFKHGHNNRGSKHWKWNGGMTIEDNSYILILSPKHSRANSRGYVREHVLVMEQHLGR